MVDISDRLINMIVPSYQKQIGRSFIPTGNKVTLKIKNDDDYFTIGSNASIYTRSKYVGEELKVKNKKLGLLFTGIILDIDPDHKNKTASLFVGSEISQYLDRIVVYTSGGDKTPAELFIEILDSVDFPTALIRTQENSGTVLRGTYTLANGKKLQQVLEELAKKTNSNIYEDDKGNLFFEHNYIPSVPTGYTFTFDDNKLFHENIFIEAPVVIGSRTKIINKVSAIENGGAYADDEDTLSITNYGLHEIKLDGETEGITYESTATRDYFIASYLNYYKMPIQTWKLVFTEKYGRLIEMNRPFIFNYRSKGANERPMKIIKITKDFQGHKYIIEAQEIPT